MDPMEQRSERKEYRTNHTQSQHSKRGGGMARREKKRLVQLFCCIVLFAVIFLGKQFLPWDQSAIGKAVSGALGQTIDFKAAFSAFGEAVSDGEPLSTALSQVYLAVFHPDQIKAEPVSLNGLAAAEVAFLSEAPQKGIETVAQYRLKLQGKGTEHTPVLAPPVTSPSGNESANGTAGQPTPTPTPEETPVSTPTPAPTPTPTPAPTPEESPSPQGIAEVNYTGRALPEKTSMEKAVLTFSYMTPVSGKASSEFGYRSHPIDGEYKFHYGLDIAAKEGAEIKAFADGTVDYIGQSDAYGNYTRLSHKGGITSFYAHCSKVLVQKGQTVKKGDVIALVGDTGNATGSHLHLEIKKDGVFLNPHYYVDVQ